MTPREKLSYISRQGIILKKDKYLFRAYPNGNSPVLQMEDISKWNLIEKLFDLIMEYK